MPHPYYTVISTIDDDGKEIFASRAGNDHGCADVAAARRTYRLYVDDEGWQVSTVAKGWWAAERTPIDEWDLLAEGTHTSQGRIKVGGTDNE